MSVKAIEAEVYIQSGVEADVEIGREIIKTVYEEPVLEQLEVTANGTYEPEEGVDGYSDVTVNVPGKIPVLEQLKVIANGEYYPAEGVDGFGEVSVDVSGNLKDAYVCEGNFKGTESGVLTIDTGYDGYGFPVAIFIRPTSGILSLDDDFLKNTKRYAINSLFAQHMTAVWPTYVDTSEPNRYRSGVYYKNSSSAYYYTGGTYNITDGGEPSYGASNSVKMSDSRTIKIYVSDEVGPSGSSYYFPLDVTYKYMIIYSEPKTTQDSNVVEGEFIGTEDGTLRVDIPYNGDTFPKMIIVYVEGECLNTTGDFIVNANLYAINVCQLSKMYSTTPSYNGNSNPNFARVIVSYKASNTAYNQTPLSGYSYNQGSCNYNADCLKFRDNKTMDVFIKTERNPTTGGVFFMKGIRYKYKVFY